MYIVILIGLNTEIIRIFPTFALLFRVLETIW